MIKVFLGGTCAESTWRKELIPLLDIPYFNPLVEDCTPACQVTEELQKSVDCNIHLYVITKEMTRVFSIAEVIESVHMKDKITILHVMPEGLTVDQLIGLKAVSNMVIKHGGISYVDPELHRTARVINYCFK